MPQDVGSTGFLAKSIPKENIKCAKLIVLPSGYVKINFARYTMTIPIEPKQSDVALSVSSVFILCKVFSKQYDPEAFIQLCIQRQVATKQRSTSQWGAHPKEVIPSVFKGGACLRRILVLSIISSFFSLLTFMLLQYCINI